MEQAMASRAVIEQAKGVLMGRHAIDETQAFEVLRRHSQNRNVKLRTLAAEIVAGVVGRVEHLGEGELPA
jgi:AmiR/NasT family two-component response regulator